MYIENTGWPLGQSETGWWSIENDAGTQLNYKKKKTVKRLDGTLEKWEVDGT